MNTKNLIRKQNHVDNVIGQNVIKHIEIHYDQLEIK